MRYDENQQKSSYSDKKRRTIKNQIVINGESDEIIAVHEEKGSIHDMGIFKMSKIRFVKDTLSVGHKGYQGLRFYHANPLTPYNKP